MSLRSEFLNDLENVFFIESEFACVREFGIVEDDAEKIFVAHCVWDTESLKTRPIVQQQGLFLGSVLCFVAKHWFAAEPRAEQIIYSPVTPFRIGWRVIDCTDAEECFELYLDKLIA